MPNAYILIEDFKAGLDTRRLSVSAAPGSLQVFENGHINRGGEIEKAKKWASKYTLPAGTFGLAASNNSLYVFGSGSTPGGMPSGVNYTRIINPDDSALERIVSVKNFSGKLYAVGKFVDGTVHHFYDGELIKDWYVGLVRSSLGTLDNVAEEIMGTMIVDPVMTASRSGADLILTGNTDNVTFDVTATAEDGGTYNDETITVVETQAAGASQPQITTATLGGTFDPGDLFTITVEDNIYGAAGTTGEEATVIVTHKSKVYAGAGRNLFFSALADATLWRDNTEGSTVNTGSGVIDISAQSSNDEDITGLEIYQGNLGVFTRNSTQIWAMDPNPGANQLLQTLDNTGTRSPRSIKSFGDLDLFYLHDSGIRSLRARDSSNAASVTDVGTPIDELIVADMQNSTEDQVKRAVAEIEPRDGRYGLSLKDTEYIFTYFQTSKISAWSTYKSGLSITDYAVLNGRLYARAGDVIYLLGGDNNDEYTNQDVVIELPYIDAQAVGTWKRWRGLDVILEGTWTVYVNTNPNEPDEWVETAVLTRTSVGEMILAMQQYSPVIKLKFEHSGEGAAKISKIILHYETTWAG